MIRFLFKGIINDKSRSLLPIIVVSIGAALTVLLHAWLTGVMGDAIEMSARFDAGHLKVMTRAYAEDAEHAPNDLAMIGVDSIMTELKANYPDLDWVKRIRFGGLIDFPDENGDTRAQGPVVGWAVDMFSPGSKETERFNMRESLVQGNIPTVPGEALITDDFAVDFNVKPGDEFTLFGTTMDGGMAFKNFIVSGTIRFGSAVLDRGSIIIDVADAQLALAMDDAASEILGFLPMAQYDNEIATEIAVNFEKSMNVKHPSYLVDEYAPVMLRLRDQGIMAEQMDYSRSIASIMIFVFVMAMSIVLWNAGLLGGLRRYSEFGVRLALGEQKTHIYSTLIYEAILIGAIGSIVGTAIGLGAAYYLQEVGVDISGMMQNSSLMMPAVVKAAITPTTFYIGFIPGLFSMVLGNALSGLGIYKRQTAQLFKELEV